LLGYRWLRHLQRTEYDKLYTEVVLDGYWAPNVFRSPADSVLHVDFQEETLQKLPPDLLRLMQRYPVVHTLTPAQKVVLEKYGFGRVSVIPNCLEIARFEPDKHDVRPAEPVVLYVHGARTPGADVLRLQRAVRELRFKFVTVGLRRRLDGAIQFLRLSQDDYLHWLHTAT